MVQRTPYFNSPGGTPRAGGVNGDRSTSPDDHHGAVINPPGSDGESTNRGPIPFVWQHEKRLLLLDEERHGWVLAELQFNPKLCRYVEVRRAIYTWPREAVGAVLSRALASGLNATEDAAERLNAWLSKYHGFSLWRDRQPRKSADASDQAPS